MPYTTNQDVTITLSHKTTSLLHHMPPHSLEFAPLSLITLRAPHQWAPTHALSVCGHHQLVNGRFVNFYMIQAYLLTM